MEQIKKIRKNDCGNNPPELGLKSTPKKRIRLFMRYLDYEQDSLSL
jgi:hypothetical protein